MAVKMVSLNHQENNVTTGTPIMTTAVTQPAKTKQAIHSKSFQVMAPPKCSLSVGTAWASISPQTGVTKALFLLVVTLPVMAQLLAFPAQMPLPPLQASANHVGILYLKEWKLVMTATR